MMWKQWQFLGDLFALRKEPETQMYELQQQKVTVATQTLYRRHLSICLSGLRGIFKKFTENAYYEKVHGFQKFLQQNILIF